MPEASPTVAELSRGFGALVPKSFETLWSLAHDLLPEDPKNAFDPIELQWLGTDEQIEDSYDTPPEFFTFGWTGCDSSRYGFIIDDLRHTPDEYPIAHSEPVTQLVGRSIAEFLGFLFAQAIDRQHATGLVIDIARLIDAGLLPKSTTLSEKAPVPPKTDSERAYMARIHELLARSKRVFDFNLPADYESFPDEVLQARIGAGAIPTADQIGVIVPDDSVDREFLKRVQWPEKYSRAFGPPDFQLLDEAERRLRVGQPGTTLVIARNFRWLFWYDDWKQERAIVRRTADIMAAAYNELGRGFLADRVYRQTAAVLENVI